MLASCVFASLQLHAPCCAEEQMLQLMLMPLRAAVLSSAAAAADVMQLQGLLVLQWCTAMF
jgi:hypothetical protein